MNHVTHHWISADISIFHWKPAKFSTSRNRNIDWHPNLSKKLKNRIQASQNKCIRFCLQLGKMSHIPPKDIYITLTPNDTYMHFPELI